VAAESSTEAALAALYAHVQSMPESAQKKRLVSKLNEANGQGTPGVQRSGRGEGLRGFLTPKRSSKKHEEGGKFGRVHGSYNLPSLDGLLFKAPPPTNKGHHPSQLFNTFKQQPERTPSQDALMHDTLSAMGNQKLLSPQSSPALLVSPSAIDSIVKKTEEEKEYYDDSKESEDERDVHCDLDGSYEGPSKNPGPSSAAKRIPPPVPERVSSLNPSANGDGSSHSEGTSPLSSAVATSMASKEMQKSMMTPRSRKAVHVASHFLNLNSSGPESSCSFVPGAVEDEPEEENSSKEVEEAVKVKEEAIKFKNRAYTSNTLRAEFEAYLNKNNIDLEASLAQDTSVASSQLNASTTSSAIGREADRLLSGEQSLSESMRAVMDGEEPSEENQKDNPLGVITPSVLVPVDVDSPLLSDITEEEDEDGKENNPSHNSQQQQHDLSGSFLSAKSQLSAYSTASTLPCTQDIPLPTYEEPREIATFTISYPNDAGNEQRMSSTPQQQPQQSQLQQSLQGGGKANSRKRRSLTEISDLNPMARKTGGSGICSPATATKNIFFETDL